MKKLYQANIIKEPKFLSYNPFLIKLIFNFNPLNRPYLYPPFFSNTRSKKEKGTIQRENQLDDANYFVGKSPRSTLSENQIGQNSQGEGEVTSLVF